MEREFVEAYIEAHYNKWQHNCRQLCWRYGLADQADDILQEAICVLLKKLTTSEMYFMAHEIVHGYSLLDLFVIRAYKNKLMSDITTTRRKAKKVVRDVNIDILNVSCNDIDEPRFDVYSAQQRLRSIVDQVEMPEKAKRHFVRIAVCGNLVGCGNHNISAHFNAGVTHVRQYIQERQISIQ